MTQKTTLLCMGLSTMILAATQVKAQNQQCGPHADVVAYLAETYAESRQMIGLAANNAVLEVFAAENGSWTVLVTTAGGPACLVASGQSFQQTDDALPNTDEGA